MQSHRGDEALSLMRTCALSAIKEVTVGQDQTDFEGRVSSSRMSHESIEVAGSLQVSAAAAMQSKLSMSFFEGANTLRRA